MRPSDSHLLPNPSTHQTVFLIDHLWCTTLLEARAQLTAHPFIRRNLQVVLGIGTCCDVCNCCDLHIFWTGIGSDVVYIVIVINSDEESESDADDDDTDEAEAEGGYGVPSGGAANDSINDETAMRARLLAFLGVDDADAAALATTTEVDLDGIVEASAGRPEPAFLSYILRALPTLFPNVEALSLQSLGLGPGWTAEVRATVIVCI